MKKDANDHFGRILDGANWGMPINLISNAPNYFIRILKSKIFQTKSSKLSFTMPGLMYS
ncbi:uncharacterized protein METZ01_LOCUS249381, partial [marine metagenome]